MRIASRSIIAIGFSIAVAGQANAIPGYEIRSKTMVVPASTLVGSTAFCTPGKKVLGGGFDIQGGGPQQPYYATRSEPSGTQNGWDVNVRNNGTVPVQVSIWAVYAP